MWDRKQVKQDGKKQFKKNYWPFVIICFLLAFLGCEYSSSTAVIHSNNNSAAITNNVIYSTEHLTNMNVLGAEDNLISTATEMVTNINAYIFKLIGSVMEFFNNDYTAAFLLGLVCMVQFCYVLFICNPFVVGSRKFFIENRNNENAKISNVLYPVKCGNFLNIVKIMFMQLVYLTLWILTIIGVFIKMYEYRLIPYILAETPELSSKEVFAKSRNMMRGNKWKVFVFDFSFIGWYLLTALTFGLAGIFYSNPYKSASMTEIYFTLKENIS